MEYKGKGRVREHCLECGHTISYGRTDKKFCCDDCKNKYHNRTAKEFLRIHSKTIHILDKNYRILNQCLSKGQTSMDLGDAIQWGFNPEYVTGLRRNKIRWENRCFDIKYLRSDNKIYRIEKVRDLQDDEK